MEAVTRLQLLEQLEQKYMGKMVKHTHKYGDKYDRVQNITCEHDGGDGFMVIVQIGMRRFEYSLDTFEANTILL